MITVRFSKGQAVQYNDAHFAESWDSSLLKLSTKKDGAIVALVPKTCIIECQPACRVYNPVATRAASDLAAEVGREVRRQLVNAERRRKAKP